jgi:hypothetical protein
MVSPDCAVLHADDNISLSARCARFFPLARVTDFHAGSSSCGGMRDGSYGGVGSHVTLCF